jgi:hypothetical protein
VLHVTVAVVSVMVSMGIRGKSWGETGDGSAELSNDH